MKLINLIVLAKILVKILYRQSTQSIANKKYQGTLQKSQIHLVGMAKNIPLSVPYKLFTANTRLVHCLDRSQSKCLRKLSLTANINPNLQKRSVFFLSCLVLYYLCNCQTHTHLPIALQFGTQFFPHIQGNVLHRNSCFSFLLKFVNFIQFASASNFNTLHITAICVLSSFQYITQNLQKYTFSSVALLRQHKQYMKTFTIKPAISA